MAWMEGKTYTTEVYRTPYAVHGHPSGGVLDSCKVETAWPPRA